MEIINFEASIWQPEIQSSQVCSSLQDFQASSTESHQGSRLIMGDQGNSDILKTLWKTKVLDTTALSLSHRKLDEIHIFITLRFFFYF